MRSNPDITYRLGIMLEATMLRMRDEPARRPQLCVQAQVTRNEMNGRLDSCFRRQMQEA